MYTRLVYIDSCFCLASVKGMYHNTRLVFQDLLCRAVGLWDLQVPPDWRGKETLQGGRGVRTSRTEQEWVGTVYLRH